MVSDTVIFTFCEEDKEFYWDNITFMVGRCLFRVPMRPFVEGSPDFVSRGYRENDVIVLPTATPVEFRTFLRFLFPKSRLLPEPTVEPLPKQSWVHILKTATDLRFNEVRRVAISHLERLVEDPIEFILLGRAFSIMRWLLTGLADISTKSGTLSEPTSELIGYRTTVRVYIVREKVRSWDGVRPFHDFLFEEMCTTFHDEVSEIRSREGQYKTKDDIANDEALQIENEERLRAKAERALRERKVERLHSIRVQRGQQTPLTDPSELFERALPTLRMCVIPPSPLEIEATLVQ